MAVDPQPTLAQLKQWFDEAQAIADSVERAHAMEDLAFDAEQMARDGRRDEAITLFEWLAALDRDDDLLQAAIASADEHLISLGVRTRPTLDAVVAALHEQFSHLPEREQLVAVATLLTREHGLRRPEAWSMAADLLARAHTIQPLTGKASRLRLEVLLRAQQNGEQERKA